MPTIRDVARHAEVSQSTVSLVLNGRGSISMQTKRRVLEAIERIHYKPKQAGRPVLAAKGKDALSIVVAYPQRVSRNGVVSELTHAWLSAIRHELVKVGHHLSLLAGNEHVDQNEVLEHMLDAGEVDGIILIGVTHEDGYLERCLRAGLPLVVMNRTPRHGEFSYVGMDNYGSGERVVAYLKSLGHRRIGVVAPAEPYDYAIQLRDGIAAGFGRHGLEPVFGDRLLHDDSDEQVRRACRGVLDAGATAAYVTGDGLAVRCMDVWEQMGVSVPGDLSIVGHDALTVTSRSGLVPTSVGYDKRFMGCEAVRILLQVIDRRPLVHNLGLVVQTHIVERDTTGPAPG